MKTPESSSAEPEKRVVHKFLDYTYSRMYDNMWNTHYWRNGLKKHMEVISNYKDRAKDFQVSEKQIVIVAPNAD